MEKKQSLEDYIRTIDALYQEHGISGIRERSYTEVALLQMLKQHDLEKAIRRLETPGGPDVANIHQRNKLEKELGELRELFGVRVAETLELEDRDLEIDR